MFLLDRGNLQMANDTKLQFCVCSNGIPNLFARRPKITRPLLTKIGPVEGGMEHAMPSVLTYMEGNFWLGVNLIMGSPIIIIIQGTFWVKLHKVQNVLIPIVKLQLVLLNVTRKKVSHQQLWNACRSLPQNSYWNNWRLMESGPKWLTSLNSLFDFQVHTMHWQFIRKGLIASTPCNNLERLSSEFFAEMALIQISV